MSDGDFGDLTEALGRRGISARVSLTLQEAAGSLGVSLSTFRRHILPQIKSIKVGKLRLVSVTELSKWAEEHGTLNTAYEVV